MDKKLVVDVNLEYEPILKSSPSGYCELKCPLGDCLIRINLNNSLERVRQIVNVKTESIIA